MPALPHSSTQQFIILPVWGSSYLYVLVHLSERPEGSPSFSSRANTLGARGLCLRKVNIQTLSLSKVCGLREGEIQFLEIRSFIANWADQSFTYFVVKASHIISLLFFENFRAL